MNRRLLAGASAAVRAPVPVAMPAMATQRLHAITWRCGRQAGALTVGLQVRVVAGGASLG